MKQVFHRRDTAGLDTLGSRLVSYCGKGDVFCDPSSEPDIPAHVQYHETYKDEVVEFIMKQYEDPDSAPAASEAPKSGAVRRAATFQW